MAAFGRRRAFGALLWSQGDGLVSGSTELDAAFIRPLSRVIGKRVMSMASPQDEARSTEADQADDILRSFKDWLNDRDAEAGKGMPPVRANALPDGRDRSGGKDFHSSAGISPAVSVIDRAARQASPQSAKISRKWPWLRRPALRAAVVGAAVIVLAGAALAWQSSGKGETKAAGRSWLSLSRFSSLLGMSVPRFDAAMDAVSDPQAPGGDVAMLRGASATSSLPASAGSRSSTDPQHRLDSLANDVAAVRRTVERLAARQEQMTQDIAALQAGKHNARQKLSPSHAADAHVPPPGNGPRSESGVQRPSAPVPAAAAATRSPAP
jgi:hypothetical protein